MFEEAISILSICSSMYSWLTPTVLFFLLNFMIGTIFFTSGFSSHKPSHHNNHHNNHLNNHQNHLNNNQEFHQQQQQQQQPTFQYHQQQQQQQQSQLISRSSSVLQRLKSINFNNIYTFYTQPPTTHYQSPPQQPEPESRPEPEHETSPVGSEEENDEGGDGEGPTMEEIYSRIKQGNQVSHYGRQNSDTKPSGGEIPIKLPQKMKKSASVKSAFNHFHFQPQTQSNNATNYSKNYNSGNDKESENVGVVKKATPPVKKAEKKRESAGVKNVKNASIKEEREDEAVAAAAVESSSVDAQADDFINRFKKQLQLQRNDSILRYKDMISRFSAK